MRVSRFVFLLTGGLLAGLPHLGRAQATAPPQLLPAADTVRLTLPEVEQRFVANNLQVLAQTYNISTAQALARQARLIDNPTVVLEQNALNRAINREHFGPGSPGQVAVQATQLFSLAGRRRAAGRVQQQGAVVEQFNLENLVRNLRFQLRATYYDLYFQQQTLKVYQAEVDSLSRNIVKYQQQYERGNIALKEVVRLKAFLFALQGERQAILATVAQQQSDLHILLRDPAPTEYKPTADLARLRALSLDTFSEAQLADTAAATRADVQARRAAVVQQTFNLKYQQKLVAPYLALGYVYDKAGSYIADYHAFTVGMAVPFFNRNQGNIQAAKAQIAGATAQADAQQLTVRAEVFQAYELARRSDALFQTTDRDTTPFARLMQGIERSYAKRVLSVEGYDMKWTGDFENQRRAQQRLTQVVPVSLALIFFILFILFGNIKDAGLVLINVPFAIIGGIAALLLTGTNFSISAGIGFIALFGICIQNGVILISVFKQNLVKKHTLDDSINEGVISRVRPVVMTALMATIGLMPAAISTGIGSETSKPLAIVVIGGLITGTVLTLFVFPLVFERFYRSQHTKYVPV